MKETIEAKTISWKSVHNKEGPHYNIYGARGSKNGVDRDVGIDTLKVIWPEGEADDLNFCLFGTSGIHGSYGSVQGLEESCIKYGFGHSECEEEYENMPDDFVGYDVTFLVVHPRLVCLRYGNVRVTSMEDIEYLKKLRDSSALAVKNFLK